MTSKSLIEVGADDSKKRRSSSGGRTIHVTCGGDGEELEVEESVGIEILPLIIMSDVEAEAVLPGPIGQQDSCKVCSNFINRKKLTLINDSDFVDAQLSPFVATQFLFVKRSKKNFYEYYYEAARTKNIDQLLKALNQLKELLEGDQRSASCITAPVAMHLVQALKKSGDIRKIKFPIITILSHARFDVCGAVMKEHVVPLLIRLVSDPYCLISNLAVRALTRLLCAFPKHMIVLVDQGALEAVYREVKVVRGGHYRIVYLSNFLAALCRGYSLADSVPSDKVGLVLAILADLFRNEEFPYLDVHIAQACNAISYLSYGRCLDLEEDAWKLLAKKLIDFISLEHTPSSCSGIKLVSRTAIDKNISQMIAGSALGIVGNIVRWGSLNQIRSLIMDHQLMICLRAVLHSEFKKFRKEACQIITNIVAQSETFIKDVVEEELIELLCHLLENDEPDVKMEAACAVYVSMYGYAKYEEIGEVAQDIFSRLEL